MTTLRRFRAIMATAATWSLAWAPFALVPLSIVATSDQRVPLRLVVTVVMTQAMLGAIGGALFAAALTLSSRSKRFEELRVLSVSLWGAGGGLLLPLAAQLTVMRDVGLPVAAIAGATAVSAALGATCAASTLWIARRAPQQIQQRDTSRLASGAA
jgi:hypothetical protein